MKPVHVKAIIYIDFAKENSKEGPKFKVGYLVRISIIQTFCCKRLYSKLVRRSVCG